MVTPVSDKSTITVWSSLRSWALVVEYPVKALGLLAMPKIATASVPQATATAAQKAATVPPA